MIGRFPSIKMQRMVAFESLIEQDYLYLLDFDPAVVAFTEQPVRIEYEWEKKQHHYTPDFHVVRTSGQELVECKPKNRVSSAENQRKFRIAQEWCQERDWHFQVVTGEEIRQGVRLKNIKLLTRHARIHLEPGILRQATGRLQTISSPQTLLQVAQLLFPEQTDLGVSLLLHLAYFHQIEIPVDEEPISLSTLVQFTKEA